MIALLLLIHCLLMPSLLCGGGGVKVGHCYVVHYLIPSFAIISLNKKESWLLYFNRILMTFCVCLFLVVLWVGLQCVVL